MTELAMNFLPQAVNNAQIVAGSLSVTIYCNGTYYKAERIRPEFPVVPDDARLESPDDILERAMHFALDGDGRLSSRADVCKTFLLGKLTYENICFKAAFEQYLQGYGLDSSDVTDSSYYEALKLFTETWLQLEAEFDQESRF